MTPEEKERIAEAAAKVGVSVSDFVRLTMRQVTSEPDFRVVLSPDVSERPERTAYKRAGK